MPLLVYKELLKFLIKSYLTPNTVCTDLKHYVEPNNILSYFILSCFCF